MQLSGEQVLTSAPPPVGDAAALVRHGVELQALGHWAEAREPLLRASVLAPTNPDAWLQTAIHLGLIGLEDQADQAAAALRQLRPAWVSPALERFGMAYAFGPPRETYRWFRGFGLPSWADISVMVVLAPIEVLLLTALFTGVVLVPLRALLGQENALVAALEDSFPSFGVESGEEI